MKWMTSAFLLFVLNAEAQVSPQMREGNALYRQGKFDKALPLYEQSVEKGSAEPVSFYNLGNAYFRNEKYEEAERTFDRVLNTNADSALRQRSFYNKGVSLSKQNKLEESIAAYKEAVLLDPADEDARINLQKALLELKKKQPPDQQKKDEQKKDKQKNQDRQKPPPRSNLTKKQVEQLLKALQQREQQVQQKMQQSRSRSAGRQEKDW